MVKTIIITAGKVIEGEVIERDIAYEDAKKEVGTYLQMKETSNVADLHQNLRIPVITLVKILEEYEKEGKIEYPSTSRPKACPRNKPNPFSDDVRSDEPSF